jgi:hypothetical protein
MQGEYFKTGYAHFFQYEVNVHIMLSIHMVLHNLAIVAVLLNKIGKV